MKQAKNEQGDNVVTIIESIKENGGITALSKMSIKAAEKMLVPSESVMYANIVNISIEPVSGRIAPKVLNLKGKINGVIVVTDKRIFFCNNIFGRGITKQIRLSDISSIDDSTSFIGTSTVRICGLTEMFVVDGNKKTNAALVNAINSARL